MRARLLTAIFLAKHVLADLRVCHCCIQRRWRRESIRSATRSIKIADPFFLLMVLSSSLIHYSIPGCFILAVLGSSALFCCKEICHVILYASTVGSRAEKKVVIVGLGYNEVAIKLCQTVFWKQKNSSSRRGLFEAPELSGSFSLFPIIATSRNAAICRPEQHH